MSGAKSDYTCVLNTVTFDEWSGIVLSSVASTLVIPVIYLPM